MPGAIKRCGGVGRVDESTPSFAAYQKDVIRFRTPPLLPHTDPLERCIVIKAKGSGKNTQQGWSGFFGMISLIEKRGITTPGKKGEIGAAGLFAFLTDF